jgi:hypothetical protein
MLRSMCTLAAFHIPDGPYPVVIATNRDERVDRPSRPFGRHWPGKPWRAGQDALAGGTWAGLHDAGYGVFLLNREHSLGPEPGKASRGTLALELLEAGSLAAARRRAEAIDPAGYRPFHAILASADGIVGVTAGPDGLQVDEVQDPLSIWTAHGRNTDASGRQRVHRPAFEVVLDRWRAGAGVDVILAELADVLARPAPEGHPPHQALCIRMPEHGFGTRSSLLLAFPGPDTEGPVEVRVAEGPPDETPFMDRTQEPPVTAVSNDPRDPDRNLREASEPHTDFE